MNDYYRAPSVFSVKKAMQTYARQGILFLFLQANPRAVIHQITFFLIGGTSAIFICDDGMQLISKEDREERIAFYANHNIGWVARPGHSSAAGGFKRAGKFKKASKYVSLVGLIYWVLTSFLFLFRSMNYGLGKYYIWHTSLIHAYIDFIFLSSPISQT